MLFNEACALRYWYSSSKVWGFFTLDGIVISILGQGELKQELWDYLSGWSVSAFHVCMVVRAIQVGPSVSFYNAFGPVSPSFGVSPVQLHPCCHLWPCPLGLNLRSGSKLAAFVTYPHHPAQQLNHTRCSTEDSSDGNVMSLLFNMLTFLLWVSPSCSGQLGGIRTSASCSHVENNPVTSSGLRCWVSCPHLFWEWWRQQPPSLSSLPLSFQDPTSIYRLHLVISLQTFLFDDFPMFFLWLNCFLFNNINFFGKGSHTCIGRYTWRCVSWFYLHPQS